MGLPNVGAVRAGLALLRGARQLFLRVASHQFALRDDVTFHRRVDFFAFRAHFQIERSIERKDFEIITVCPGRRSRSVVALAGKIVCSLHTARGNTVLRDLSCFWIDVPN